MPFRKKYRRKRRYRKRGKSQYAIAKHALNVAKRNQKLLASERKYFDSRLSGAIVAPLAVVTGFLCQPVRGTSITERIGDKIRANSLKLRLAMHNQSAFCSWRVTVLWVNQNNGLTPAASQFLDPVTAEGQWKHNNFGEFKVIFDKRYSGNSATARIGAMEVHNIKLNRIIKFDANAGAITDVDHNALCLFITISDVSSGAFNLNYVVESRVYYSDT